MLQWKNRRDSFWVWEKSRIIGLDHWKFKQYLTNMGLVPSRCLCSSGSFQSECAAPLTFFSRQNFPRNLKFVSSKVKMRTSMITDTEIGHWRAHEGSAEEQNLVTDGLAMGLPVSPIVANNFMENLESNAILTMRDRPRLWLCFVDEVLANVKRTSLPQAMLEQLTKHNTAIKFTMEVLVEKDGKLPFLEREVERENARLNLSFYRKPTHSGHYTRSLVAMEPQASYDRRRHRNCFPTRPAQAFPKK